MSKFLGSHAINMDAKGRIAIPARVREELAIVCEGRVILTAHHEEPCLMLYPEPEWEELRPKLENIPNMNKAARRLQRLVLGMSASLELDGSGRIVVPPTLRDHGKLEKKVMMVGLGKKLEIWSEELWQQWMNEDDDGELPEQLQGLSL